MGFAKILTKEARELQFLSTPFVIWVNSASGTYLSNTLACLSRGQTSSCNQKHSLRAEKHVFTGNSLQHAERRAERMCSYGLYYTWVVNKRGFLSTAGAHTALCFVLCSSSSLTRTLFVPLEKGCLELVAHISLHADTLQIQTCSLESNGSRPKS